MSSQLVKAAKNTLSSCLMAASFVISHSTTSLVSNWVVPRSGDEARVPEELKRSYLVQTKKR
jgi:hypothetical protein